MANWMKIGSASEIGIGSCRVVDAGAVRIAVFNAEGTFYALDNTCAHRGGPLAEGPFEGRTVTCPWHHWSYDVTTGRTTTSADIGVKTFPVELRGEDLYVDVG